MATLIIAYYKGHTIHCFHYFELDVSIKCPSEMETNNKADSHNILLLYILTI